MDCSLPVCFVKPQVYLLQTRTISQSAYYNSRISLLYNIIIYYNTNSYFSAPGLLTYIVTVSVIYGSNKSLPKQLPALCCATIPDSMMIALNDQTHQQLNHYHKLQLFPITGSAMHQLLNKYNMWHVCSYSITFKNIMI